MVQERDDVCHELFKVRLTLADAWNIKKDTNHEKIWEVLRRTRENSETDEEKETYSTVVKSTHKEIAIHKDSMAQINDRNVTKCSSTESADSGIGMQSITQLIDERVNLILEGKVMKPEQTTVIDIKRPNNVDVHFAPVHAHLDQNREQNVIVHGLNEGDVCDNELIKDILAATATQHEPEHMMRLGSKNDEKIRPMMLRMKNKNEKEEFMSKLWILKNAKTRIGNISITNDYTQEERYLIKKWVNEATRRNANGTNGYRWKVRGTPREGLRLVKIMNQE